MLTALTHFWKIILRLSLKIWSIKFICITPLAEVFLVSNLHPSCYLQRHLPLEISKKRKDIRTKQLAQDDCVWTPSGPIKLIQGLYTLNSSNSMTFHDFFHYLFQFSMTLDLPVAFKKFQKNPCFRVFFDITQFNRHNLCLCQSLCPSCLLNVDNAQTSTEINLTNKTLNFLEFP